MTSGSNTRHPRWVKGYGLRVRVVRRAVGPLLAQSNPRKLAREIHERIDRPLDLPNATPGPTESLYETLMGTRSPQQGTAGPVTLSFEWTRRGCRGITGANGPINLDTTSLVRYYPTGRARRGASGALYPQSAIAGSNSLSRGTFPQHGSGKAALKAGSHAAEACEPRQVREEAAVSSSLRVTRECLVGAGCPEYTAESAAKKGARP